MDETAGAPSAPVLDSDLRQGEATIFVASQWKLIWWRFRKHKLAMVGAAVTIVLYLVGAVCEFLAPFDPSHFDPTFTYAPPQRVYLFQQSRSEGTRLSLHVLGWRSELDTHEMRRVYVQDRHDPIELGLFVRGDPYKLWGLFPTNVHLFGPKDPERRIYLLGGDRLGRDMLSRLVYGARISLSIGLVGMAISFFFGILLGGLSGYYGGTFDVILQRIIELLRSVPSIPLWMGLAAAIPKNWPIIRVYFGITVILSFIGWTGLARVVRSRFLSLRNEDFVMMAELDGASDLRIVFRYLLPSFMSHVIASVTLSIPGMILSETSLSYLGLGLREPAISWGVLLQSAQKVRVVVTAPWLMLPALAVIVTVLAMNFFGDGLRDAADPYSR